MNKFFTGSFAACTVLASLSLPAFAQRVKDDKPTATPIQHVVVIFGENISFDHYFGTYPNALNPPGEPAFHALPNTPAVNGLTSTLLDHNQNFLNAKVNGDDAVNPFRLSRSQAATADENHDYTAEQSAFNHGLMDSFPHYTGIIGSPAIKKRLATEPAAANAP